MYIVNSSPSCCLSVGWTMLTLWADLENAWRKTCQILRKWTKTLKEKGKYSTTGYEVGDWILGSCWGLELFLIWLYCVEKSQLTRRYSQRTCGGSFRGRSGRWRKRRLWRGLLDRSTTRISGDKVTVKAFLKVSGKHFCADMKLGKSCAVKSMLFVCLFVYLRGQGARCRLLFVFSGWRAPQEAKRNSGYAQRPGELLICGWIWTQ